MSWKFPIVSGRKAIIAVSAVSLIVVAAAFWVMATRHAHRSPSTELMTAERARAIGAEWRSTGGGDLGRRYADALLNTAQEEALISEIRNNKLLGDRPNSARLYEAEAYLRLRDYSTANAIAETDEIKDDPFAAFIRARTEFALGKKKDSDDLATALRYGGSFSAEAWLLRAREALDANELDTADAAARRAREAGADSGRVEVIEIEAAIRRGELQKVGTLLAARADALNARRRKTGLDKLVDLDGDRLRVMMALLEGDPIEAARLADRAGLSVAGDRFAPLAALAKWEAGDNAQSEALLRNHLEIAPADWRALDLLLGISETANRTADIQSLKKALRQYRPALASYRAMMSARKNCDTDGEYYAALSTGSALLNDEIPEGAIAALLGRNAAEMESLPEPSSTDRQLISLVREIGANDSLRAVRIARNSIGASPVELALSARAYADAGLQDEAMKSANASSISAPDFLAPLLVESGVLQKEGANDAAIATLGDFVDRNPGRDDARLALAAAYFHGENFKAAAATYASTDPRALFVNEDAATNYARAANEAGAAAAMRAIEAAQEELEEPRRLAEFCEMAGDDAAAASVWRDLLISAEPDRSALDAYRRILGRLGRAAEGERFIGEILRRHPNLRMETGKNGRFGASQKGDSGDF